MHKLICLLVLTSFCLCGCTKEYEPPKESIPDIPPGRSAVKAQEGADASKSEAPVGKKAGGMPPAAPR